MIHTPDFHIAAADFWPFAGKLVASAPDSGLSAPDEAGVWQLGGKPYQLVGGYFVPYFKPAESGGERHHIRERLNMELCDRVFRISDARDVTRDSAAADESIDMLMARYASRENPDHRGTGRVLFGRIVARIRTLSKLYLDLHRSHAGHATTREESAILKHIHDLYHYVMVEQRDIFACVRLYDHSIDHDGIIEEVFSEIGKTQQMPIEAIYTSRVMKIGAAMGGMAEVERMLLNVLRPLHSLPDGLPIDEVEGSFSAFTRTAQQLVGIPSSDHLAYDAVASHYVDVHDAARDAVQKLEHTLAARVDVHLLTAWLRQGIDLIHSMQNLRDRRAGSIAAFAQAGRNWLADLWDESAA